MQPEMTMQKTLLVAPGIFQDAVTVEIQYAVGVHKTAPRILAVRSVTSPGPYMSTMDGGTLTITMKVGIHESPRSNR